MSQKDIYTIERDEDAAILEAYGIEKGTIRVEVDWTAGTVRPVDGYSESRLIGGCDTTAEQEKKETLRGAMWDAISQDAPDDFSWTWIGADGGHAVEIVGHHWGR